MTSGLRLGTAAETTAGMGPAEMARIAGLIGRTLRRRGDDATVTAVRAEVAELCAAFPPYPTLTELAARAEAAGEGREGCRRSMPPVGWYALVLVVAAGGHRRPLPPGPLALAAGSATSPCPTTARSTAGPPPTAAGRPCSWASWWP